MNYWMRNVRGLVVTATVIALFAGCSNDKPMAPGMDTAAKLKGVGAGSNGTALSHEVEFSSRVATVDVATRTLTFTSNNQVGVAAANVEIRKDGQSGDSVLAFSAINVGDSVEVRGDVQSDSTLLLSRIRIEANGNDGQNGVEFSDSISAIDYATGTFTVFGRSETIVVDSTTRIFAHVHYHDHNALEDGNDHEGGDRHKTSHDSTLAFVDLKAGDLIEVEAVMVNATTLKARSIQLVNERELAEDVEFTSTIATIDSTSRAVTFAGLSWMGQVDAGAELSGLHNSAITLGAFAVGDRVAVKGFQGTGNALTIVRMKKEN